MAKLTCAAAAALALLAVAPIAEAAAEAAAKKRTQLFAPRNDLFANAYSLSASRKLSLGRILDASREFGEPKVESDSIGRTVWYRYKSTTNGRAVVAITTGRMPAGPLQVAVYKGSKLATLSRVGTAVMAGTPTSTAAAVAFATTAGDVFTIQVDSGPQVPSFNSTSFQIGVDQFGATGGLAVFDDRPHFLNEGVFGPSPFAAKLLAVNAYPRKVKLKAEPFARKAYAASATATSLAVGKTAWVELRDDPNVSLPEPGVFGGTLTVSARDVSTNAVLSSVSRPVHLFRQDFGETGSPEILLRYEHALQGVLDTQPFQSKAYVRNTSLTKAFGCRFTIHDTSPIQSLSYSELTTAGVVAIDQPFDMAPGQERVFSVKAAATTTPSQANSNYVNFTCGNINTQISSDALSRMAYGGQLGLLASLVISTKSDNDYKRIAIRPSRRKTVVMALRNNGEYSGDFAVNYNDSEFNQDADVTSVCVSSSTGKCLETPVTGTTGLTMNIAPGETAYLAMKVTRGTGPSNGLVILQTLSKTREGSWDSGVGGFEVVPK